MPRFIALLPLIAAACWSCSSGSPPSGQSLRALDFAADESRAADASQKPVRPVVPAPRATLLPRNVISPSSPSELPREVPYDVTGPLAASDGMFDVTIAPGEPVISEIEPTPVEAAQVMDAKVGDIDGRAIYASSFFREMEARLTALAETELRKAQRESPRRAYAEALDVWEVEAQKEIDRSLRTLLEDELLRREALASLTPEQRVGFRAFVQRLQRDLYSEAGGSRAEADRRARLEEGKSIDELVRTKEQRELIRYQLGERIYSRIQVSFADIRNEYEKRFDTFNRDPVAHFRLLSISKRNAEALERARRELTSAESFVKLAEDRVNLLAPGVQARPFEGEFSAGSFFAIDELNAAARTLSPGTWAGPIEAETDVTWILLERIERREISLYEAQLSIESGLRDFRGELERKAYVDRLTRQASFDDLDVMGRWLREFSRERFFDSVAESLGVAIPTATPAATPAGSGS
ncbi:MAG: hypothetical protein SFZ23_09395 [Planctomycetota bacterium]|nr:hypothetical protein [Planctomycetota bacterium]